MRFADLNCTRLCRAFSMLLFLATPASILAQTTARKLGPTSVVASASVAEQRAARALEAVRQNPLELRDFLVRMPKGGDLHSHLAGAVYAESWIRDGADNNLCIDLDTLSLFKTDAMTRSIPPQPVCGEGNTAVSRAFENQHLYDSLVDAFSMRSFVPSAGVSGHDHFFDAFAKFQIVDPRHTGEWLDEVATRAAAQNEQYLELMVTPPFPKVRGERAGLADPNSDFGAFEIICKAMELKTMWPARSMDRRGGAVKRAPALREQLRCLRAA